MKKRWILALALTLAALTCSAAALQREQQALASRMIRLHVLANSDTAHDQAVKLQVRDAVLAVTDGLEREDLPMALSEIRQAAYGCLRQLGEPRPVTVTLGYAHFPSRQYEGFALPAGVYETLRVEIGTGQGHNWWCVAFPSLCLRATLAEAKEAAVSAGFQEKDWKLITGDGGTYVLKWKLLEVLDGLKQRLF